MSRMNSCLTWKISSLDLFDVALFPSPTSGDIYIRSIPPNHMNSAKPHGFFLLRRGKKAAAGEAPSIIYVRRKGGGIWRHDVDLGDIFFFPPVFNFLIFSVLILFLIFYLRISLTLP